MVSQSGSTAKRRGEGTCLSQPRAGGVRLAIYVCGLSLFGLQEARLISPFSSNHSRQLCSHCLPQPSSRGQSLTFPPFSSVSPAKMDSSSNGGGSPVKKHEDIEGPDPNKASVKADSKPPVRTLNRVPRTLLCVHLRVLFVDLMHGLHRRMCEYY